MASGNQHIQVNREWHACDLDPVAKNWVSRLDGNGFVRMSNRAAAMLQLQRALNHLLALCPRVVFCKAQTVASHTNTSSEPSQGGNMTHMLWKTFDQVPNGTGRIFRVVALPREGGSGNGYFQRTKDEPGDPIAVDATTIGPQVSGTKGSAAVLADHFMQEVKYARPTNPGARESEGIATFNAYELLTLLVQDEELNTLDASLPHDYIPHPPVAGDPVLGGQVMERVRDKLHEARSKNMPILVNWAAYSETGTYKTTTLTANQGDPAGIRIDDATNFRNLLKPSSSAASPAFSNTGPGWPAHVKYCGVGTQSSSDVRGTKLKVEFHILAAATTANGTVRVIGPSTFSTNTTDITITSGAAPAWYGGSSNTVYLDTSVDNDDNSATQAPIIQIHGKAGTSGVLYIYGIRGLAIYGL
jgi:hypothetical protein